jgi:hypothetical protein
MPLWVWTSAQGLNSSQLVTVSTTDSQNCTICLDINYITLISFAPFLQSRPLIQKIIRKSETERKTTTTVGSLLNCSHTRVHIYGSMVGISHSNENWVVRPHMAVGLEHSFHGTYKNLWYSLKLCQGDNIDLSSPVKTCTLLFYLLSCLTQ